METESQEEANFSYILQDIHDIKISTIATESILRDLMNLLHTGKDDRQRIASDIIYVKQTLESLNRKIDHMERRRSTGKDGQQI